MLKMLNISNNYVDLYRQIICKEIYRLGNYNLAFGQSKT